MSDQLSGDQTISFVDRMKHFTLKFVQGSEEPHKLYAKRNGTFVHSFGDSDALHRYVMGLSMDRIAPNKISRNARVK